MEKIFLFGLFFYMSCFQIIVCDEDTTTVSITTVADIEELEIGNKNESVNSTLEIEMTLEQLEENMKLFLKDIFRRAFPYISKSKLPPHTSTMCLLNLARMYFGFNKLEPWAFQMMDSSGKLSGGLLEGTSSALGDYDECLDVIMGRPYPKQSTGSYCLLEVKPPEPIINALKEYQINKGKGNISLATSTSFLGFLRKVRTNPDHVMFRLGICMPSTCDEEDVQDIINMVASRMDLSVHVKRCEHKQELEFQVYEIIIMVFLSNIMAASVVGTLVEIFYIRGGCGAEDNSVLEPGPDASKFMNTWRRSKLFEILSKFSLCNSFQKLLLCNKTGDALDVIRGIKVLTVIFTIYTHTYALPHRLHLYRFRDTLNFSKFIDGVLFGTVANGSVGVDTIFFIAGFLFIYYRWRLFKKPPIFTYILKFVGVNYIRMLSAQLLVGFLFALFPLLGSGPLWHEFVEEPLENCVKTWWFNLLFIQNFLGPYDSCLYHTWILATMMQLFILTALIVWIMHKNPLIGVSVNIGVIGIAIIAVAIVTVVEDFPATFTIYFYDFRTSIKYFKYLYVQSYNHIGPFCIGMLVAYYIAENPPLKTKKPVIISLWIASCVTCCSIVFGLYHYREEQDMDQALAVFYSALHRPAWGLAMGWIVYACTTNNGGFINSILSWKGLIPLERLCYLAYLLHIPIMYYHGGVQRERMYMGHYNQVMCFFSYLVASFLVSLVCYLLFQYPYHTIEKYIFGIHKETIWQVENSAASSETLKTDSSDNQAMEDNSKVLYSRYDQNIPFSEVQ